MSPQEIALLAAIRAATEDDAPRLVYADWLLERGDVHGEYITLACADARGELADEARGRMNALLEEHEVEWLGEVANVTLTPRRWSRGLPKRVQLSPDAHERFDSACGDPAWRMVQIVEAVGRLPIAETARLLQHEVLRDLHGLAAGVDVLAALLDADMLPRVELLIVMRRGGNLDSDVHQADRVREMTALAARLARRTAATMRATPASRQLRRLYFNVPIQPEDVIAWSSDELTLGVAFALRSLLEWRRALEQHGAKFAKVSFAGQHGFSRLTNFHPLETTLRRDDKGRWSRLEIRWSKSDDSPSRADLLTALDEIEDDALTEIVAEGPVAGDFDARHWIEELKRATHRHQRYAVCRGHLTPRRPWINFMAREVNIKVVYCGPEHAGKTTSIRRVDAAYPTIRGKAQYIDLPDPDIVTMDFVPRGLSPIRGFGVRVHLCTARGQDPEKRREVLRLAHAVVFVADSQRSRMNANVASLAELRESQAELRLGPDLPLVFVYNKRDVEEDAAATITELQAALDPAGRHPWVPGIATRGDGVFEGLKQAVKPVLEAFKENDTR